MKVLKWAGAGILAALAAFLLACPLVNNWSAGQVMDGLRRIPLPEDTQLLDQVSRAGKLAGNGNGMQFFGAILLKSSLPVDKLDSYYAQYRAHDWECAVERQEGQDIRMVEHGTLVFSAPAVEDCYIVYSWGDGMEPFSFFDLRGH